MTCTLLMSETSSKLQPPTSVGCACYLHQCQPATVGATANSHSRQYLQVFTVCKVLASSGDLGVGVESQVLLKGFIIPTLLAKALKTGIRACSSILTRYFWVIKYENKFVLKASFKPMLSKILFASNFAGSRKLQKGRVLCVSMMFIKAMTTCRHNQTITKSSIKIGRIDSQVC